MAEQGPQMEMTLHYGKAKEATFLVYLLGVENDTH